MKIMKMTPTSDGAYSVQDWPQDTPPDGYAVLPMTLYPAYLANAARGVPKFSGALVIAIADNTEAVAAIQAEQAAAAAQQALTDQITALKAELAATDYKVIKNEEYAAAGLDPAYDPTELYTARQAIRDQINTLEEQL